MVSAGSMACGPWALFGLRCGAGALLWASWQFSTRLSKFWKNSGQKKRFCAILDETLGSEDWPLLGHDSLRIQASNKRGYRWQRDHLCEAYGLHHSCLFR